MNLFMRKTEKLKDALYCDRIIALWILPNGQKAQLPVDEGIAAGAEFIRVLDGSSIEDAEKILDYVSPECAI